MRLIPSAEQQREMRHAHLDGAPGILVSGLVWLTAALVSHLLGVQQSVWTLLIGGALIAPLGMLVTRIAGRPAKTGAGNALNQLAMASTVWLVLCCAMAYGLFLLKPTLFFPAMMATIGSRYMIFATVFGRATYWMLGVSLLVAANIAFFSSVAPSFAAGLCACIELVFAYMVYSAAARQETSGT